MEKLPVIPSPPGTTFREFRHSVLPYVVFTVMLVSTVVMWRRYVGPSAWVGEVEMTRSLVSASQPSRITRVLVGPLEKVREGQPVVEILAVDPKFLEAQSGLTRARMEYLRLTVEPKLRKEGNQINYTQLRLDWLRQRVELAGMRAQQAFFEAEADRMIRLSQMTNGIAFVTVQEVQAAERDLAELRSRINEQQAGVDLAEQLIAKLGSVEDRMEDDDEFPRSVKAALEVEQRALEVIEAQLKPSELLAPMDGFVSAVHRQSGESVLAGEAILTISGTRSERIMAYLRQPLQVEPTVGMRIEVRSRSRMRNVALAEVVSVGSQMEPILPELLPMRPGGMDLVEYGLPLVIRLPPELGLIPGEIVDLRAAR
jgi:multidrug resistance efflux pump